MQELRFVAVSEDGSYAVLAVPGRSGRYVLPIDERLRAVALGQTSRLAQYEIEVESPLRPKEIQARIRAGETAEEIADAAGIPVERVRWFEGPVLAERAYIAEQAQAGSVRRAGESSGPGPRLGDIVTARLTAAGSDPGDGQWDSRKRGDGHWQISLTFPSGGRVHVAEWVFDPRRRHVMPDDDNAARLSLPESELPPEPVTLPGEATVTPIASRLGAAAGMGAAAGVTGFAGAPGASRFRPERSVIPDRSLGADRSLVDRPHADRNHADRNHGERAHGERALPPQAPAGYQTRQGPQPGYAEFPESAPYRTPEHSAPEHRGGEPGYRDRAVEPSDYRAPVPPPGPAGPPVPPVPAAPPAAYREQEPGPAAGNSGTGDPALGGPGFEDSERTRRTATRHVVFEEPEPALLAGQLELTADSAPAVPPAPVPAAPAQELAPPAPELAPEPAPLAAAPPAPAGPVAAEPVAAEPVAAAAARPAPDAEVPEPAEVLAPAEPAEPEEQTGRPRPGAKKNAKARRSSVPSWDEIMLGSSRPRD
jgi:hypothetical protein